MHARGAIRPRSHRTTPPPPTRTAGSGILSRQMTAKCGNSGVGSTASTIVLLLLGGGPRSAAAQSAQGRCLLAGNGLAQGQCCDLDGFCNIYWRSPYWAVMVTYNMPNMECCQCQWGCRSNRARCSGNIDTTSSTCRDFNRASTETGRDNDGSKDDNDNPDDARYRRDGTEGEGAELAGRFRRGADTTTGLVDAPTTDVLAAAIQMYITAAGGQIDETDFDTGTSIARRCTSMTWNHVGPFLSHSDHFLRIWIISYAFLSASPPCTRQDVACTARQL